MLVIWLSSLYRDHALFFLEGKGKNVICIEIQKRIVEVLSIFLRYCMVCMGGVTDVMFDCN